MHALTLEISYRPLRIGMLIEKNNYDQFRKAVQINTVLYGGINNPIIAVDISSFEEVDNLIKLFHCDVLHSFSKNIIIEELVKKYKWLKWPITGVGELFTALNEKQLSPLDVVILYEHFWETEFKYDSTKSNCSYYRWRETDPMKYLFSTLYGEYPDFLEYDYEKGYLKALKAKEIDIFDIVPSNNKQITPISLTKTMLKANFNYRTHSLNGIYIGNSLNLDDLIEYWNLRASGIDIKFWDKDMHDRMKQYIDKTVLEMVKINQNIENEYFKQICVYISRNEEFEIIRKHVNEFLFKNIECNVIYNQLSQASWNTYNIKSKQYSIFEKSNIVTIHEGKLLFELPPRSFKSSNPRQLWVVNINCSMEEYYMDDCTIDLPFIPEMNEIFSRKTVIMPEYLRVQRRSIGIIKAYSESSLSLYPINSQEIIKDIFHYCGITSIPSKPGKIAKRIINQLRGLEKCRVLKIPGVRRLAGSEKAVTGINRDAALEFIGERFNEFQNLYIEKRDNRKLHQEDVFNYLLNNQILRLGAKIECPNCMLDFWLAIDKLLDQPKCELCGHVFPIGPQLKKDIWSYRLNGLFNTEGKQQGAIPVILSLLQLKRIRAKGCSFVYSTALELEDHEGLKCEVDVVTLDYDRDGNPSLLIGECKNRGSINKQDVDNLLKVYKKIRSKNITCYLLFAKASGSFDTDEINLFKELMNNHVPITLFTSNELEPYEPYEKYLESGIPHLSR